MAYTYIGFGFCKPQGETYQIAAGRIGMGMERAFVAVLHAWYSMNSQGIGCNKAMVSRQC
jgi:hypothetical protein